MLGEVIIIYSFTNNLEIVNYTNTNTNTNRFMNINQAFKSLTFCRFYEHTIILYPNDEGL